MNTQDIRIALKPKGKSNITRLNLENHYFNYDFVEKAIRQLEMKILLRDGLSPLETLGVYLLFDSAGVEYKQEELVK